MSQMATRGWLGDGSGRERAPRRCTTSRLKRRRPSRPVSGWPLWSGFHLPQGRKALQNQGLASKTRVSPSNGPHWPTPPVPGVPGTQYFRFRARQRSLSHRPVAKNAHGGRPLCTLSPCSAGPHSPLLRPRLLECAEPPTSWEKSPNRWRVEPSPARRLVFW